MIDKFHYTPGEYKVLVPRLHIRGTPSTGINNLILNPQGVAQKLIQGQSVPVYRTITTKSGWIWGIINQADKDHYICLWDLNTRYAELVKGFKEDLPSIDVATEMLIMKHERDIEHMKEWMRIQGYKG